MDLTNAQENALNTLQGTMTPQEQKDYDQYNELRKHNLPIPPALYRALEAVLKKYGN